MKERFSPYLSARLATELRLIAIESDCGANQIIVKAVEQFINLSEAKKVIWNAARELRDEGEKARAGLLRAANIEREGNRKLLEDLFKNFVDLVNEVGEDRKTNTRSSNPGVRYNEHGFPSPD